MIAFSFRRWFIAMIALTVVSTFYFFGFQKVSLEDVQRQMRHPKYSTDRETESARMDYAWYDYMKNPPLGQVNAELPEGATRGTPMPTPNAELEYKTILEQEEEEEKQEEQNKLKIPPAQPFPIPAFSPGNPTLPSSEYSRMLVLMANKDEISNLEWIREALTGESLLGSITYILDDDKSAHPASYGKSSVYLDYIINHYNSLREITLFMHAEQGAWQLDRLLNNSAQSVISLLDHHKVIEDGFVPLRCTLSPGCPTEGDIFPNKSDQYEDHPQDIVMNSVWKDFFGAQQPPKRLAEPAYGQYALSRERIQAIPKSQYEYLLKRLAASAFSEEELDNFWSHAWHYLWSGEETRCAAEDVCFCETYSICFKDTTEYEMHARELTDLLSKETSVPALAGKEDMLNEINELKQKLDVRFAEAQARGEKKKENSMSSKISAELEILDSKFDKTVDTTTDGVKGLWDAVKEFAGTEDGKKLLETGSDEGHVVLEEKKPKPKQGYSPGAERRRRSRAFNGAVGDLI
ncbi:hypothetical protein EJ05DRAFT_510453 [Pseudovirgaria hyperparasitica]|uniref:Uncharacterized protein n=1 Tax=Pseudovirgaria hyperparasitica TaxID=470096 RepID=A0A6A6W8K2_9PEZI|nr:uncharacterized protein EJ05DRAFT_510453 [Pseudovirgaria hyperparasitica]KAF2758539.1 hypothetical protein EJ05DRAFT_510453 [Pseudovirgaria hyperparasitica]